MNHTARVNPLFEPFTLPPFDKVDDSDFEPAMTRAISEAEAEIGKIAANRAKPTFQNTIAALDSCGALLDKVESVFFHLHGAASNPTREELARKFAPILSRHHNNVMLDEKLFSRVKHVWDNRPDNLDRERHTLLEKTFKAFVRNGALLDSAGKEQLRKATEELSGETVRFAASLLHARNDFHLNVTDGERVAGVPETALAAAAANARENGRDGWDITLDAPVYMPFMAYCPDRALRRELYMARNSACMKHTEHRTVETCERIVNLRLRIANLLGYQCYADFVLERRMAGNRRNVNDLLSRLTEAYLPQARREVAAIERHARESAGDGFRLEPWDFAYYSRKLKRKLYDIDSETLRPYLELAEVRGGVFGLASDLYGIRFEENTAAPVYADGVTVYSVSDKDGSFLGTLYVDWFPRKGKQGGAWCTNLSPQYRDGDRNVRPVVAVVMNLTKPSDGRPALLTLGEANTFLHEFGHALHCLFANTTYRSLSGTGVFWDFVELPSQFMENFATEKKFLSKFAKHHLTGEPLPAELVDRVVESRNHNVGYSTIRQVEFGKLDMALYTITAPLKGNLLDIERESAKETRLMPEAEGTAEAPHFSHIMDGGYAAGYYSYKWAEVLDADAFKAFREKGVYSKEMAARFRDCILSRGGTEPPMTLYERFRGKKPTIEAMMERDGLATEKSHSQ